VTADDPLKVGDRVRVVRSKAGHGTCIGKVGTVKAIDHLNTIHADFDGGAGHYGPASDFERIDPEPTTEPTVTLPVALIDRLTMAASGRDVTDTAAVAMAHALAHPKPAPRRLRVVDLDELRGNVEAYQFDWEPYMRQVEAAPDVLAIVAREVRAGDMIGRANENEIIGRIRAALEEAVDR
jgi:hypothetical protein